MSEVLHGTGRHFVTPVPGQAILAEPLDAVLDKS